MAQYIYFNEKGQQEGFVQSDKKPAESGWFLAPKAYNGTRLCVLENNQARLLSDAEINAQQAVAGRKELTQNARQLADSIRADLVAGTSALMREGYQVKANISLLYRIETALKQAGVIKASETLLNADETAAIDVEIAERGRKDDRATILKIWEAKSGRYAQAVCKISGVETKILDDIKAAAPDALDDLARNMQVIAAAKRAEFNRTQGVKNAQS